MENGLTDIASMPNEPAWHEVTVGSVKNKLVNGEFDESLRLAKLRYEGLQRAIQVDDAEISPEDQESLSEELDVIQVLYRRLQRLADITTELSDDFDISEERQTKLIDERVVIKQELEVLLQND